MPYVVTPWGDVLEETNGVALAYYRDEPGYEVSDEKPDLDAPAPDPVAPGTPALEKSDPAPAAADQPPADNAPVEDWVAFAAKRGDTDASNKTRNQLVAEYKAAVAAAATPAS
ncbi:hypothetical protein [Jatrophihabitans sp.]|uniref:hypothetical protein n=1 Tax=Jatrophihabitans sp. TaxID=1932789 RepID=UPI0030C66643|nr:hypothetical protein [Jatrophihabitans sp.]